MKIIMFSNHVVYNFRIHDRKMCVLGLCCLLNMFEGRPAALSDLAQQIFPSLILLFNGLQRAYAGVYNVVLNSVKM